VNFVAVGYSAIRRHRLHDQERPQPDRRARVIRKCHSQRVSRRTQPPHNRAAAGGQTRRFQDAVGRTGNCQHERRIGFGIVVQFDLAFSPRHDALWHRRAGSGLPCLRSGRRPRQGRFSGNVNRSSSSLGCNLSSLKLWILKQRGQSWLHVKPRSVSGIRQGGSNFHVEPPHVVEHAVKAAKGRPQSIVYAKRPDPNGQNQDGRDGRANRRVRPAVGLGRAAMRGRGSRTH
jgi:hypothetical protein